MEVCGVIIYRTGKMIANAGQYYICGYEGAFYMKDMLKYALDVRSDITEESRIKDVRPLRQEWLVYWNGNRGFIKNKERGGQ